VPGRHMTPDEFRQQGHALVDWVASYMERVEELPVQPPVAPGAVRELLPPHAPEHGEDWDAIAADLDRIVVPGLTNWQHPGWFAFFPANNSGPSVLGELVSAGLAQQGMLWSTSPACTELETHVMDWLQEALGLPAAFRSDATGGGVIQDSASSAGICAMVAARHRSGADPARLVGYASTQTHSSIEKGLRIVGVPADRVRLVDVDDAFAMRPDDLAARVAADRASGLVPFFCCATVGTTSSLAVDPVRAIGEQCREAGMWLHVDAAMAGVAALCPEHRHLNDGLELVDSYCTNAHKWLFTNFDCDLFWVADRAALIESLTVLPEYLRNAATESGAVIDYRDWQLPLGRRFRAIKLWFVLRHYGLEGLRAAMREHVALGAWLAAQVERSSRLELTAPPRLGLVCFHHVEGDHATEAMLTRLNAEPSIHLTHTRLGGRYTIRVSIGQTTTRREHVEHLWGLIAETPV
jgi:aromatic-L-amino-acid/L-tryptophan decarboxylase